MVPAVGPMDARPRAGQAAQAGLHCAGAGRHPIQGAAERTNAKVLLSELMLWMPLHAANMRDGAFRR